MKNEITTFESNDLVNLNEGQAVTTSVKIADIFEKRHDHVLRDIYKLEKDVPNFGEMFQKGETFDSYGRSRKTYFMNRDGFALIAMGFTGKKALEFKLKFIEEFNRMEKYIKENNEPPVQQNQNNIEQVETAMVALKYMSEIMRWDEASKLEFASKAFEEYGLPTKLLPQYSTEEVTQSLTALLKEYNAGFGAAKANNKLIKLGIVEIKERPSSKGRKEFKSLTEKGLKFGKNLVSPHNKLETQPHYYKSTFQELLELMNTVD